MPHLATVSPYQQTPNIYVLPKRTNSSSGSTAQISPSAFQRRTIIIIRNNSNNFLTKFTNLLTQTASTAFSLISLFALSKLMFGGSTGRETFHNIKRTTKESFHFARDLFNERSGLTSQRQKLQVI